MLHAGFLVKLPDVGLDIVHVVSWNEYPVPFTMTRVPTWPEAGLIVILGPVTVKVVLIESPVLPDTVIV